VHFALRFFTPTFEFKFENCSKLAHSGGIVDHHIERFVCVQGALDPAEQQL
jgi:hypothetical protein